MQRILRTLLCLPALVAVAGLAACGGDKASESTDPKKLLEDTFTGEKKVDSGKFEMALKFDVKGASQVQGPVNVSLKGPFESQGKEELPKFDIEGSFEGAGMSIKAGVMTTGEKGYVNFNGTDYVVSDDVFKEFKSSFEKAAKEQEKEAQALGIDARKWLTNPKNAGEAKVGDTDTIRITGDVNVVALLDDVNQALEKQAGSLQGQLPTKLTDEQKEQIQKAVKDVKVEIFTGKEDTILRRMHVTFGVSDPTGEEQGSATVDFDLKLLDLNEGQEFSEPENPKPFEELMQDLGGFGLGGLGGLGGGGSGGSGSGGSGSGGSGSGGSGSGGSSGSAENLEKYTQCIEEADGDLQKTQKCAEIIAP